MKLLTGLVFSGWRGVSSHSFPFPSSSPPLLFFFLPALTLLYTFSLQLFQTNFRSSWAPCRLLLSCCCTGCVLCLNHLLPFLHLAMIYQYLNLSLHIMYEVFPNFHHLRAALWLFLICSSSQQDYQFFFVLPLCIISSRQILGLW